MNVSECKVVVSNNWNDSTEVKIGSSVAEVVEDFCYLGSFLSSYSNCDKDCLTRIGKAASVFGKLKAVWKNKYISFPVKVKLYESLVKSTLYCIQCRTMAFDCYTEEEIGSCRPQVSTTITGNHMAGQNT